MERSNRIVITVIISLCIQCGQLLPFFPYIRERAAYLQFIPRVQHHAYSVVYGTVELETREPIPTWLNDDCESGSRGWLYGSV